jgi:large subunit ribosomal protein L10
LPTAEKEQIIAEFKERVEANRIAIATRFIGINAEQATTLRSKLRENGVLFKVYKNTLAARALDEMGLGDAVQYMEGPTAWAFCEDPVAPAKVLKDYAKDNELVVMNGAVLAGEVLSPERLKALADLPSRDELIAKTVGTMAAPLRNFVSVMAAPTRNFVNVIEQIRKQKEEQGEGEAA